MRDAGHFDARVAERHALKFRTLLHMSKVARAALKPVQPLRFGHARFVERGMIRVDIVAA